ncbi:hypothetical protein AJ80_05736 [Polytolypa hystricis UAMH7299]|uniref:Mitochondrial export protein Som1 n=1 Tax=Polytolypa hystricis (strain UAMH7299) TaxID=1447883 RepID=A0A2B7Y1Q4_POLH7|nr:hypothetical protein AJ80_05736 [Polytolypa hystricis UAMH7299]
MAPLVEVFPSSDLPHRVQITNTSFKEKRRKTTIDLKECPLFEMTQFSCNPPSEKPPEPGVVNCKAIVRLFRKCADGLTVETTAWDRRRQE